MIDEKKPTGSVLEDVFTESGHITPASESAATDSEPIHGQAEVPPLPPTQEFTSPQGEPLRDQKPDPFFPYVQDPTPADRKLTPIRRQDPPLSHPQAAAQPGGNPPSPRQGPSVFRLVILALILGGLAGAGVSYWMMSHWAWQTYPWPGTSVTLQAVTPAGENTVILASEGIPLVTARAAASVVEVNTESKVTHPFWGSYIIDGAGSGVIISVDGYIVTNNHVIEGSSAISIRTMDGMVYPAQIIGNDPQTDLALIKIQAQGLSPVVFADSDAALVGQLAVAIGNPLGTLGGTVTEGIISAKDRAIVIESQTMTLLQTSAAINPGNSGGGLFDGQGHLLGIVSAKSSGSDIEGLGFAIPSNTVLHIVQELLENGYVTGRPSLGIGVHEITRWNDLARYGLNEPGVYVTSTEDDGIFQLWDRILRVNHQDITSAAEIRQAITGTQVGDEVEVTIQRGNRTLILVLELMEKSRAMAAEEMV